MKLNILKRAALALLLLGFAAPSAEAAPKAPKWLVLDKITYQQGVDRTAFEGIDNLLLTKLVQAGKYKCLDRDAYDTAAREEGFGAKIDLVPAGYSMRGEIVQLLRSGKSRTIQNAPMAEYIATVSLRANDLRTQQPYEAETLRVVQYCQTPKDMLVYVVQRVALAILMRDYPMYLMGDPEDGIDPEDLTLSYGADFINKGEQYEIRRRKALVDDDTGDTVYKEKTVGVCEVTDVGKRTSTARLISGKAKIKDVLRFYDADPLGVPPPPAAPVAAAPAPVAAAPVAAPAAPVEVSAHPSPFPKKHPRIAVAPFISKYPSVNIYGVAIPSRQWMDDAADHLNIGLTQCGSFRVLDRSFGPEIDRELARITNDPNADPNDVCRLSRKLATDYLVVAEVIFSDVHSRGTDYVTGLPLPPLSVVFAEVRFRCVMAPTTEIAWTDIVRLDASKFGGTAQIFSSDSAAAAAMAITDAIQNRLDPEGFARVQAARAAAAANQPPPPPPAPVPVAQPVNAGF